MQQKNADVRAKLIRQASYIALVGNFVLCLIKILFGLLSHSLAVLSDGLDSAGDTAIAIIAVIVGFIIAKPSDKEHPWGHQRAETIASLLLVYMIIFAGLQLFIAAINRLIQIYSGSIFQLPDTGILIIAAISITGKLILSLTQYIIGKKTNSFMVLATAQNMFNDTLISLSVVVSYSLCRIFQTPYPDAGIALIISCWVMLSAVRLLFELNVELMDGNTNKEVYRRLFEVIETIPNVKNPHKARIRKIANLWDIDLDIEVDGTLSVIEAHHITEEVSNAVRDALYNVYDIVIHVEPYNSARHEEAYGLSPKDI